MPTQACFCRQSPAQPNFHMSLSAIPSCLLNLLSMNQMVQLHICSSIGESCTASPHSTHPAVQQMIFCILTCPYSQGESYVCLNEASPGTTQLARVDKHLRWSGSSGSISCSLNFSPVISARQHLGCRLFVGLKRQVACMQGIVHLGLCRW